MSADCVALLSFAAACAVALALVVLLLVAL